MRNFANVGRRTISNKAVSKKISIGSAGEVDLTDVQSVVINPDSTDDLIVGGNLAPVGRGDGPGVGLEGFGQGGEGRTRS
jgi:hypothetical protein